jgi:hypothetical protein
MFSVKAEGLDAVLKKFDKLSKDTQEGVQAALNDWADRTATDAKRLVSSQSSDEGGLLRSISPIYGNGNASVVASQKYAAYIEFGTRKFAAEYVSSLPNDWQAYAATFKGKGGGGTAKEFWKSIQAWGRRKGLEPSHIYFTYKKILRDGIRPKPFLYPSVNKNLPLLVNDIKNIFK